MQGDRGCCQLWESGTDTVVLKARGVLLARAATEFQLGLAELGRFPHPVKVLDLSEVSAVSAAGLGRMIVLWRDLGAQGHCLRIGGCSQALREIFALIRLDSLIPIDEEIQPVARRLSRPSSESRPSTS